MALKTRGDIKQAIIDRLGAPGDAILDPRLMRVLDGAIDESQALLLALHSWDCLFDFVSLPITATTGRVDLPDGATVLDVNGAVAPYVANVLHVRLVSSGQALSHDTLIRQSFLDGSYDYGLRGTPAVWDAINKWLFLKPLPAGPDAVELFVIKGHSPIVSDGSEPIMREHLRGYHVDDVMARLWSVDGQDVRKQAFARERTRQWLGAMFQCEATAKPLYKAMPLMPFSTNN